MPFVIFGMNVQPQASQLQAGREFSNLKNWSWESVRICKIVLVLHQFLLSCCVQRSQQCLCERQWHWPRLCPVLEWPGRLQVWSKKWPIAEGAMIATGITRPVESTCTCRFTNDADKTIPPLWRRKEAFTFTRQWFWNYVESPEQIKLQTFFPVWMRVPNLRVMNMLWVATC